MAYRVEVKRRAEKELAGVPVEAQRRIARAIDALEDDPRPVGSEKLAGDKGYRVRVGDYRIVYTIEDEVLTVYVIRIAHRREVYRRL